MIIIIIIIILIIIIIILKCVFFLSELDMLLDGVVDETAQQRLVLSLGQSSVID